MYNQIDNNGFYLGVSKETNEGMEFFTEFPIIGNFIKFKIENGIWCEGATQEEIAEQPKEITLQDRITQLENELNEIKAQL